MKKVEVTIIPLKERWVVVVKCLDPAFERITVELTDVGAGTFVSRCIQEILLAT